MAKNDIQHKPNVDEQKSIDNRVDDLLSNLVNLKKGEYLTVFYDDSTKHLGERLLLSARKTSPRKIFSFNVDDFERYKEKAIPAQYSAIIDHYIKKSDSLIYVAQILREEHQAFIKPLIESSERYNVKYVIQPNL